MVSRLRREINRRKLPAARRKLDQALGAAIDEELRRLAWATWSIQHGDKKAARQVMFFPEEAATNDPASRWRVSPWELETLINEMLTVPKDPARGLKCDRIDTMALLINRLRDLHNFQDAVSIGASNILRDMHRLGQQQFAWQRGVCNIPNLYRNWRFYSGPRTKDLFQTRRGYSLDEFTCVCFAARAMFMGAEAISIGTDAQALGISREISRKILEDISIEHRAARDLALKLRRDNGHFPYAKSILRQYPCIRFGSRLRAPLPDLVLERAASGLMYDLVGGASGVHEEVGKRFEIYVRELLCDTVPGISILPPIRYGPAKATRDAPDALITCNGDIKVVAECKATWMNYEARFSTDPLGDARRGYEEIAKGAYQIWKFVADCRLGRVQVVALPSPPFGLIITRDTWLQFALPFVPEVMTMARDLARKDNDIEVADQIPILFCPVADLETILRRCSPHSFVDALRAATTPEYEGWMLEGIHSAVCTEQADRGYLFAGRMREVAPWWFSKPKEPDLAHAPSSLL